MTEFKIDLPSVFYIWSRLKQAKDKSDPSFGNITEIYIEHLLPGDLDYQSKDLWKQAGKTLYIILQEFCEQNNVRAFVDGKEIDNWMNDYSFFHKCSIRIMEREV